MHKHNFGETLKLQSAVVTLNIRSRMQKFPIEKPKFYASFQMLITSLPNSV